MKDFNEFMRDVLDEILAHSQDKEATSKAVLKKMYGVEPAKGEYPTYQRMLMNVPGKDVFDKLIVLRDKLERSVYFGPNRKKGELTDKDFEDAGIEPWMWEMDDIEDIVKKMLFESSRNVFGNDFGHADFFDDILYKMREDMLGNKETPYEYFTNLKKGMYERKDAHSHYYERELLDFYGEHSSSMELFKEVAEKHLGERAKDDHWFEHYVWIYFLCFEEIGYHIARTLFNEDFKYEGDNR